MQDSMIYIILLMFISNKRVYFLRIYFMLLVTFHQNSSTIRTEFRNLTLLDNKKLKSRCKIDLIQNSGRVQEKLLWNSDILKEF